jgi:hypothetical protein
MSGVKVLRKCSELWKLTALVMLTAVVGFILNYVMVFVGLLAVAGWVY